MLIKIISILFFCGLARSQNSPVFIWGSSSTPFKPALKTLNGNEFIEIIEPNLEDSMLLVFLEEALQPQDFSQCKLQSGETCFSNLKMYKTKTFYADVQDPVQSVKLLSKTKLQSLVLSDTGKLPHSIEYEPGKVLLISFVGKSEERSKTLIEHDAIMSQLYNILAEQGKVFAIYTSQINSQPLHRIRRQVRSTDQQKTFNKQVDDIGILMHFNDAKLGDTEITFTDLELKKGTDNKMEVTLKGNEKNDKQEITIKFNIRKNDGYWYINLLSGTTEIEKPVIEAAVGFSYYCSSTFNLENKELQLKKLQLQPFWGISKLPTKFNDPWHCVGFISGGIISGLFVVLLMVSILTFGITWLMDMRSMDRFDDPKGKTITINVTD